MHRAVGPVAPPPASRRLGRTAIHCLPVAIAQFANASAYQQNNVPRIGVFFNSKIKRFRVYISADELLQATSNYNRILMQGYPATDWILRAGFSWVMVN